MEKIWLVTHESIVDGMHLYDVIPCISKETAIEVMNEEKEALLNQPRYKKAREWMSGKHDNDMDDCPYEWDESECGFYINIHLDAYAEHIEVKEKEIQY